jgi:hypothetical protein
MTSKYNYSLKIIRKYIWIEAPTNTNIIDTYQAHEINVLESSHFEEK